MPASGDRITRLKIDPDPLALLSTSNLRREPLAITRGLAFINGSFIVDDKMSSHVSL